MIEEIKTLATITRHRDFSRANIHKITSKLEQRAILHDQSKLGLDELEGYARINKATRDLPYNSPEYRDSMQAGKGPDGCITLHFRRNSHHPDFHENIADMPLLDLIEMACDWKAAADGYGQGNSYRDHLEANCDRFKLDERQRWIVCQVLDLIEEH